MNINFDLSKIISDDAYNLLEEISSDGSDVSESEDVISDMNMVLDDLHGQNDFSDEHDILDGQDVRDENNDFDSEDKLPLISFVGPNEVKWITTPNNAFFRNRRTNCPYQFRESLGFFNAFVQLKFVEYACFPNKFIRNTKAQ
ncbi:hypothetical protein JTB14_013832 [Gonioctena quinquepunctata]|nr:hypothetical protein JTB14_013832 [Gonioctena quinquepunctata]